MLLARPAIAMNPKRFGKAPVRELSCPAATAAVLSDDLKLFATTFLAGFVVVSVLIG